MNAVSLQFFLLPSQLELKSGIGGACEGSCCLSQSAFHDLTREGFPLHTSSLGAALSHCLEPTQKSGF